MMFLSIPFVVLMVNPVKESTVLQITIPGKSWPFSWNERPYSLYF